MIYPSRLHPQQINYLNQLLYRDSQQIQLKQKSTAKQMKTISNWQQIDQYHSKCVCQTCTCHKHRCPKCEIHVPFDQGSSYQNDYIKHPINTWQKGKPEDPKPYQPYGDINSSYQASYPGHKPQMRQKIVPRVKNENKDVPFDGESEYKNKFPGKMVPREKPHIKDHQYNPSNQPFEGDTTYKNSYPKKVGNPHQKKKPEQFSFPNGYKFNGSTTYNNSYDEKPYNPAKSCKPIESLRATGPHDLNTIYRKDFDEKKIPEPCPILKMPERSSKVSHPAQHLVYNKFTHSWEER